MKFRRDVTRSNDQGRRRIGKRSSRKTFVAGADRVHKVNTSLTPAMSERGGIRL